jgi:hypothetical protein
MSKARGGEELVDGDATSRTADHRVRDVGNVLRRPVGLPGDDHPGWPSDTTPDEGAFV